MVHSNLALICVQQGKFDEAIGEAQRSLNLSVDPGAIIGFATILAKSGKKDEARTHLDAIDQLSRRVYVSPVSIAMLHAALGDPERALEWLQTAYDGKDDSLLGLNVHPFWDSIRSDPRFIALLEKIGFPK